MERAAIVKELDAFPGQDVVLVKYTPDFDPDREWVYNGADIDGQKLCGRATWARKRIRSYGIIIAGESFGPSRPMAERC